MPSGNFPLAQAVYLALECLASGDTEPCGSLITRLVHHEPVAAPSLVRVVQSGHSAFASSDSLLTDRADRTTKP